MIPIADLRALAMLRLNEAETLFANTHFDAAIYLSGYSVEMALKARICETLGWEGFPSTNKEFENYQSFRTHNLTVLLHLSGFETTIKSDIDNSIEWAIAESWNPELRYRITDSLSGEAENMIKSARILLKIF
jgi:HEPN domain-containing protein